MLVGQHSFNI